MRLLRSHIFTDDRPLDRAPYDLDYGYHHPRYDHRDRHDTAHHQHRTTYYLLTTSDPAARQRASQGR
jgi:hypothetical protein